MIDTIRGSDRTQEQLSFEIKEIHYNTHTFGRVFSNIFMSYLLDYRVKIPNIDFKHITKLQSKTFL